MSSSVHHFSPRPSVASVMQLVYDHDGKSVVFSRVFRWQSKFHEKLSFRLCRSTIHSLIFWFFNKLRKDLKEKRSYKSSSQCHLESYHAAASLSPGLLVHKNVTGVVQMDRVQSCSSKAAEENEENIIKVDVSLNRQNIKWFASIPVTDFLAGRARFDISAEFFKKIIFRQEWRWNAFFLKTGFKIGVRIIHGCALHTGKYGVLKMLYPFSIY